MKRRRLTPSEMELYRKFRKPGGHNLTGCKVNQFNFSKANSKNDYIHERKKWEEGMECLKKDHAFLQEAYEIRTKRIRDHVCLTDRIIIEWENNRAKMEIKKSEGAYESPNCAVEVVMLWQDGKN